MTPAQSLRLRGFNASLAQRGVSLLIGEAAVNGLVETVDEKTLERLKTLSGLITHVIHIKRTDLDDAVIELDQVSVISREEGEGSYRVATFDNDPQRPQVLFHCTLAGAE